MTVLRKGEMTLKVVWDYKINETKYYEQHFIAGYLPERLRKFGDKYSWLPKEWFIGQAERDKRTGQWIQDSIRIVRVREGSPNAREIAEKLALIIGWFYFNTTKKGILVVDSDGKELALFGNAKEREKFLKAIECISKKEVVL